MKMAFNTQKAYYKSLNKEIDQLVRQFDGIPIDLTDDTYNVSMIYNDRNKYSNIRASDNNYVKITKGYINASYILDKDYIAAQYPITGTVDHFWALVFESSSRMVVNLSGNSTYLKKKTKFNLDIILYDDNPICECRQITISNDESEKIIHHITFKTWPDHGIPTSEDFSKLMNIINVIETFEDIGSIITHCMAGVGRTGTFILIHSILKNARLNKYYDPIDIVSEMRKTRAGMIQTCDQFKFAIMYVCKQLCSRCIKEDNDEKKKLSSSCGFEFTEKLNILPNPLSISYNGYL